MIRTSILMCLGLVLSANLAMAETTTAPVSSKNVFIPSGFDDNDRVSVVLDGYMPNSCYKLDHVEQSIDQASKTITLKQIARIYEGPCLMMMVPYTTSVNVGILAHGDYTIVTNNGLESSRLSVNRATNAGPDDHLYAPVEQATVKRASDGTLTATIEGRFTNTCMKITDLQAIYSGKSVMVLPIMEVEEREDCVEQDVSFEQSLQLNSFLPGRYLLHVRSLNGQAVNTVFSSWTSGIPE